MVGVPATRQPCGRARPRAIQIEDAEINLNVAIDKLVTLIYSYRYIYNVKFMCIYIIIYIYRMYNTFKKCKLQVCGPGMWYEKYVLCVWEIDISRTVSPTKYLMCWLMLQNSIGPIGTHISISSWAWNLSDPPHATGPKPHAGEAVLLVLALAGSICQFRCRSVAVDSGNMLKGFYIQGDPALKSSTSACAM